MDFAKYSSIENSNRLKTINDIVYHGFDKEEWVTTEKVDGSNFSFHMNKDGLRCARRSGFLTLDQDFYNHKFVTDMYDQHLSYLYQVCKDLLYDLVSCDKITLKNDNVEVVLYGELIGGKYNHKEVPKDNTASKIQGRVQYCSWNDFYAFDLKINGAFINYDVFEDIMKEIGFIYAKSLYRGSLMDCLKFPNDLETWLPEHFGLPKIENNISEGVVIKPVSARFFNNGSRVILKNKNELFSEVEQKEKKEKPIVSFTIEEQNIVDSAQNCITVNRLNNIISHIGKITDKDFGKLLGLFSKDVLEEVKKDFDDFKNIEKDRVKLINKQINLECASFIRDHFVNIIDETM